LAVAKSRRERRSWPLCPHAACVVTLIDRLIHRAEVIDIEADSYRLKEANELTAARTKQRNKSRPEPLACSPVNFTAFRRGFHRSTSPNTHEF